ncbi:MAG TPA: 1,4-dihydroxy-2-naphthoate octaprenyltransferase [Roseiflexaceae bacterium]|nr:1,4-dihydroxy-2-naphthoate octaprenyltransferase [Roseiflexaceae bacterium]
MHSHWYKWFITFRPWSYTAAVVPVLLGSAIAVYNGVFHGGLFLLTLIGSVALQAGTNLVNDYYDDKKGLDQERVHGPGGFIQKGEIPARSVLMVGVACFVLGAAIGLYLVSVAGLFILWLGVFSVAVGFLYTAGPVALAYIGMGEITVFVFMGPVIVIGSYYVQARSVPLPVVLASLPVGFLVAAILHANNLRDLDFDRQFNKRTLATVLGRHGANVEYYALIGATYAMLVVTVLLGAAPWFTLLALLTLPMAVRLIGIVARETEPAKLQPVLRGTGQLHMRFGGLVVIGWMAAWLLNIWPHG